MENRDIIEISGAGPAGLAAALLVHRAGGQARIYERRKDVDGRFHGDFQGLENWTSDTDVLQELQSLGIQTNFDYQAFNEVVCFDPDGKPHNFHSRLPLFYLIKRGAVSGSLDLALKQQALDAGVEIHFGETISDMSAGGIVTHGPQRPDVIAADYLFDTDMADGAWAVVSDDLAPKGYAYVQVHNGKGTLASCMYADFHHERDYVSCCVDFFHKHIHLSMKNEKRFGGAGNSVIHNIAHKGNILYAGEAAGFQDALFGFGMRWAMLSGAEAARTLMMNKPDEYERILDRRLRKYMRASEVNRWFYHRLGNRGYRSVLARYKGEDAREWMHRAYRPRWWTPLMHYLFVRGNKKLFLHIQDDCDCTWCRYTGHARKCVSAGEHEGTAGAGG